MFLAVQNKVIIGVFESRSGAQECIDKEIEKDRISIMITKKLRKLFLKDPSNFALHRYCILECSSKSEVDLL